MIFTSQIFIFLFFPISILFYYAASLLQSKGALSSFFKKIRLTDLLLISIGCCFYMWTSFKDLFRFLGYIFVIYLFGLWIQHNRKYHFALSAGQDNLLQDKKTISAAFPMLCVGVLFSIYILLHFKYTQLFAKAWNFFFKDTIAGKNIAAPLGISFISFSAISYLADIYSGKAKSGNLMDCMLYLTFFPKVVSGPIVLWRDFKKQIEERSIRLNLSFDGANRIMVGFAKKLILADTFGAAITTQNALDTPTALGTALLYMLQIYYDFSGYSDIAIGLSNMLGFHVKENFNFPYLSRSISEFWRRWHISLGTWFREYIYIPLGGSRAGKRKTLINIGVVFFLTGIWHGAGWTYMLWGMVNGVCIIIEKLLNDHRFYRKTPNFFKWLLTMGITFFSWQLFRFHSFSAFKGWLLSLLGLQTDTTPPYGWQYYFDRRMIVFIVIALLGSTLWGLPKIQNTLQNALQNKYILWIYQTILLILFIVSLMFMINSKYSPFIYFQY